MSLEIDNMSNRAKLSNEAIDQFFSQLKAEDIEQFYMAYQLWSQRQQIDQLQLQMHGLQQKIDENTAQMAQFQPSAIALASLAQLQAYGVGDINLLDKMLERGEEWLDHSIQLLERCEQLDLIGGDYTQWCIHALEGAYDWLDSMTDASEAEIANPITQENTTTDGAEVTEEQLLKKLMSEEGDGEKARQGSEPRITQPLAIVEEQGSIGDETQKAAAIKPLKRITQPLLATNEPAITDEQTDIEEDTKQVATIKPLKRITQLLPATNEPVIADEQVEISSSELAPLLPDQSPDRTSDNIITAETNPEEQIDAENSTVATQVGIGEISNQESYPINIEENEINVLNSTGQIHETAPFPSNIENKAQKNEPVIAEHIDQHKIGDDAESRSEEESRQQVQLQDLPLAKKKASKKKKGFLRWLLAKILRR